MQNRDHLENQLLKIARKVLEEEADEFANGTDSDTDLEKRYEHMSSSFPITELIAKLKRVLLPDSSGIFTGTDTFWQYSQWRCCIDPCLCEDLSSFTDTFKAHLMEQCQYFKELISSGLRTAILLPPAQCLLDIPLSANICEPSPNSSPVTSCQSKPSRPFLVEDFEVISAGNDAAYRLELDPETSFHAVIEIGNTRSRLSFFNMPVPVPEPTVFLNGIGKNDALKLEWESESTVLIRHSIDYPELSNISFTPYTGQQKMIFIIWSGVEKKMIDLYLEHCLPDRQSRLRWWYTPIPEFDGRTPLRCMEGRHESELLKYLKLTFPLPSPDLESRIKDS
jgi:hypothetical protein